MYKIVLLLCVVPFVQCNFGTLNIQQGTCPTLNGAANFNAQQFAGIWTVSQRSNDLFAHGKDCETQAFLLDGTNFQVFTVFSNPETEIGRAFHARSVTRGVGVINFARSLLSDNIILQGTTTVVATDNNSFAVLTNCYQFLNFRITTIYVLIKGVNAPANLDQLVNQALANNQLTLNPPLQFRDLQTRCV